MNFRVLALAISVAVAAPAFAASDQPAALHALGTFPANKPAKLGPSTEALDGTAFYSNVTNFQALAFANGGAAADPAAPANTMVSYAFRYSSPGGKPSMIRRAAVAEGQT